MPTAVKDYEGTKKAIDEALDRFSLEYIDMLLIHSPQPWIEVNRTTTKLPTAVKDYEGTKKAIDEALDRFSLEYIDMLLIHSPQPWIEVNRTNDRHFEGNLENWRAMEEAVKAGKVR